MEGQVGRSEAGGNSGLLRSALLGNALFSGVSGLALLLAAQPLAQLLGLPGSALILRVMGVGLLLYAGFLATTANRAPIDRRLAWEAVILDVLWVAGSLILLSTGWVPFSTAGKWAVALVADAVAIFAVAQYVGIRRLDKVA